MAPHNTKFNLEWQKDYSFIQAVKDDKGKAHCTVCGSIFLISHGGKNDIKNHVLTERHQRGKKNVLVNHNIKDFFKHKNSGILGLS